MQYKNIYSDIFENCQSYNSQKININYAMPLSYLIKNKDKINNHIDISSGRGNFLNLVRQKTNIISTFTDIKKFNNLNNDFIQIDLSKKEDLNKLVNYKFDVLTCLDVLQHIQYQYIDDILYNFSKISNICLLTIANHQDIYNGNKLHIVIEDIEFWKQKIQKYFNINIYKIFLQGKLFYFQLDSKK